MDHPAPAPVTAPEPERGDRPGVLPVGGLRSIVIVGPTASGKTALAIEVAEILGDAEIVSVDSMQVYRRMDIGTGKATPGEQSRVPHHLLDLVEPSVEFSAGWFRDEARAVLDDLAARGRRAILVGGTGLYHRVVVDDLCLPGDYDEIRSALEAELAAGLPPEVLHRRLAEADPVAAARIEPANGRRIVRALEVTTGSGRLFSSFGPGLHEYPSSGHLMVGLRVDRDDMGPRVAARVAAMMAMGFLDEVRSLLDEPAGLSRTARQALGYRQLLAHLDGSVTLDEAVCDTIGRTRQFAVRQERWFRRDPRIEWVDAPERGGRAASETRSLARSIAGRLEAT